MISRLPDGQAFPIPQPQTSTDAGKVARSNRALLIALILSLLIGGAAGIWYWTKEPALTPNRVEPPRPRGIKDAEVESAIERAYQNVLSDPTSALAWGIYAMTLYSNSFKTEADRCLAEAARLAPNAPLWPYGRGLIALGKEPEKALPFLKQAAEAVDAPPRVQSAIRLKLAEAYLERREFDRASALFLADWQAQSGNPRAALGLGMIAVHRKDDKAAVEMFAVARRVPFARKFATIQLALLARANGDRAASENYQKEIDGLSDDIPWPDPFIDQANELQVGKAGWVRKVAFLEQNRRFAEAAELYLQEIDERPTATAYLGAGLNFARLENFDRAIPLLEEAIRRDPNNATTHFFMALTQCGRAEITWQRTPGDARAKEWFRDTIERARRATELRPDHGRAYFHWGLALKYLGDPKAAAVPLRKAVECRPEDLDAQLALAEVLMELADYKGAREHLENARKINPKEPQLLNLSKKLGDVK